MFTVFYGLLAIIYKQCGLVGFLRMSPDNGFGGSNCFLEEVDAKDEPAGVFRLELDGKGPA